MSSGKKKSQQKKKWSEKLRNKYRLVILNDETFEEKLSFRLTRLNVFVLLGTISILLIFLTAIIISFTSLREYIPGYENPELPKQVYELQQLTDSLEKDFFRKNLYIQNIKNIIEGKIITDTIVPIIEQTANYDTITSLDRSVEDSLLRAEYDKQRSYSLFLTESEYIYAEDKSSLSSFNFFTPLKGIITRNFNLAENHYGIDIVAGINEAIKATLDGTVIFSDWTINTGYVIGIQHKHNILSIYKHNSTLLKKTGTYVKAGEPVAIIGESGKLSTGPHLHFELWFNGTPVNPKNYMGF
ncbi:MAG: M23 family metallopeptidase [Bacteroidales bacterium]|nr:M23 family metallopeptidase [Bacteroidales bacterium]